LYVESGWSVYSVEADKCGYDLLCRNGTIQECVEVKGVQGTLLTFIITAGEVRQVKTNPGFVICVVTHALSQQPKAYWYTGGEFIKNFNLSPLVYRASLEYSSL
jgi:Domain of unknown function (DUF3883)